MDIYIEIKDYHNALIAALIYYKLIITMEEENLINKINDIIGKRIYNRDNKQANKFNMEFT